MNLYEKHVDPWLYFIGIKMYKSSNRTLEILHVIYIFVLKLIYYSVVVILIVDFPTVVNRGLFRQSYHFPLFIVVTISALKVKKVTSRPVAKLMEYITSREAIALAHPDPHVATIYMEGVRRTKAFLYFLAGFSIALFVCFNANTVFDEFQYRHKLLSLGNSSNLHRQIRIPVWSVNLDISWLYYCLSFAMSDLMVVISTCMTVVTYLFLSIIMFSVGELRILQYLIQKEVHQYDEDEDLACQRFGRLVKYHQDIIQFVTDFDDTYRLLMFWDFLSQSLPIAILLLQLSGGTSSDSAFQLVSIVIIYSQICLNYWHANEIREFSLAVSGAVYDTNWYKGGKKVNKMALIMIMRAQRPLELHIGSIGVMSTDMIIKINKSIYSMLSIAQQVMNH